MEQTTHKLENIISKKFSYCCKSSRAHNRFPNLRIWQKDWGPPGNLTLKTNSVSSGIRNSSCCNRQITKSVSILQFPNVEERERDRDTERWKEKGRGREVEDRCLPLTSSERGAFLLLTPHWGELCAMFMVWPNHRAAGKCLPGSQEVKQLGGQRTGSTLCLCQGVPGEL